MWAGSEASSSRTAWAPARSSSTRSAGAATTSARPSSPTGCADSSRRCATAETPGTSSAFFGTAGKTHPTAASRLTARVECSAAMGRRSRAGACSGRRAPGSGRGVRGWAVSAASIDEVLETADSGGVAFGGLPLSRLEHWTGARYVRAIHGRGPADEGGPHGRTDGPPEAQHHRHPDRRPECRLAHPPGNAADREAPGPPRDDVHRLHRQRPALLPLARGDADRTVRAQQRGEVAPGWDDWHTILEPENYDDYTLRENGHAVQYGSQPRDYLTRVLNDKAVHLIHRYVPGRRPLFMAIDQLAPHGTPNLDDPRCIRSALPAPRDRERFVNAPLPMPPSFNEADVSDKPSFVSAHPRLTPNDVAELKRKNGCRLASLREVDRGVKRIVAALDHEHELGNTAIFYTSDNGFLQGEHRVADAKVDPYEEAVHVPLIVRLPRRFRARHGAPRKLGSTVANIDVAPTILRLAGGS